MSEQPPTTDQTPPAEMPSTLSRSQITIGIVVLVAIVLAIAAAVVVGQVKKKNQEDLDTDQLYCTLAGIGPYDRGPKTGEDA